MGRPLEKQRLTRDLIRRVWRAKLEWTDLIIGVLGACLFGFFIGLILTGLADLVSSFIGIEFTPIIFLAALIVWLWITVGFFLRLTLRDALEHPGTAKAYLLTATTILGSFILLVLVVAGIGLVRSIGRSDNLATEPDGTVIRKEELVERFRRISSDTSALRDTAFLRGTLRAIITDTGAWKKVRLKGTAYEISAPPYIESWSDDRIALAGKTVRINKLSLDGTGLFDTDNRFFACYWNWDGPMSEAGQHRFLSDHWRSLLQTHLEREASTPVISNMTEGDWSIEQADPSKALVRARIHFSNGKAVLLETATRNDSLGVALSERFLGSLGELK